MADQSRSNISLPAQAALAGPLSSQPEGRIAASREPAQESGTRKTSRRACNHRQFCGRRYPLSIDLSEEALESRLARPPSCPRQIDTRRHLSRAGPDNSAVAARTGGDNNSAYRATQIA